MLQALGMGPLAVELISPRRDVMSAFADAVCASVGVARRSGRPETSDRVGPHDADGGDVAGSF